MSVTLAHFCTTWLISTCQTDGLSDNVFSHEITSICSLVSRSGGSEEAQVKLISDRIIEYARACMFNERRPSPFQSKFQYLNSTIVSSTRIFPEAAAMNGLDFTGGVSPSPVFSYLRMMAADVRTIAPRNSMSAFPAHISAHTSDFS